MRQSGLTSLIRWTGVLGALCLGGLLAGCQPVAPAAPPSPAPMAAPAMSVGQQIQSGLRTLGYFDALVDGALGPSTRAAIRAFEADQGLPATGAPSPAFEQALRAAVAQRQATGSVAAVAPRNIGQPTGPAPVQTAGATSGGGSPIAAAERIVSGYFSPSELTEVDLNADGMTDVIAIAEHSSGFCGIRACSHLVFVNTGSGFRAVNDDTLAVELTPLSSTTRRVS